MDIVVIDMPILDTRREKSLVGTLISDIILSLLSYVAANERINIRQRQTEGIAAAKLRGVKFGRPPIPIPENFDQMHKEWRDGKIRMNEAAKACNMPSKTFYSKAIRYEKATFQNSTNNTQITSVGQQIWIQSTDEAHKGMFIHTVGATAKDIGINGLDVQSADNATNAINTISDAIRTISEYRSYFGAIQNRLEHAYNINLNTVENAQYAESKIRDTDMAAEMVRNLQEIT